MPPEAHARVSVRSSDPSPQHARAPSSPCLLQRPARPRCKPAAPPPAPVRAGSKALLQDAALHQLPHACDHFGQVSSAPGFASAAAWRWRKGPDMTAGAPVSWPSVRSRQLVGTLLAFDKFMNLVLGETEEFRVVKSRKASGEPAQRVAVRSARLAPQPSRAPLPLVAPSFPTFFCPPQAQRWRRSSGACWGSSSCAAPP